MTSPLLWNITALFPAAAFLLNIFVWTYVFAQHNSSPVNRAFLLFSGDAVVWLGYELLLYLPIASGHEETIYRVGSVSWIFLGFFFLEFANAVAKRKRTMVSFFSFAVALLFSALTIFTDLMVRGKVVYSWGLVPLVNHSFHAVVSLGTAVFGGYAAALIVGKRRRTKDEVERKIIDLIMGGSAVSIVAIFIFDIIIPDILDIETVPRYGAQAMAVFMLVVFYAIMKYRFLSISLETAAKEIFKDVKVGILLIDRDGTVRRANKQAFAMLGSDVMGRAVNALFLGHNIEGEFFNREIKLDEGNFRRVLSLSSSFVSEQGRLLGTILMVQDVTDQKNAEAVLRKSRDDLEREVVSRTRRLRQAQRLETIGTLAGGIAHDFNNSLSAVLGFTKAAYYDLPEGSPVKQDLDEVILAANRGKEIVEQMMSLSRKEDKSDFKVTDISTLVDECLSLLRVSTPSEISVRTEISIKQPLVNCSPTQITQVISNLYNNACHAMKGAPSGELTIVLDDVDIAEAYAEENSFLKNGAYVRITVKDTGVGIKEEHLSTIFDPFFTTKSRGEGTGLGLSSAQMIVQNHDGEILVESKLDIGTSFTVYLPVHTAENKRSSIPPPEYAGEKDGGGERILWVDDEPQMLRMANRTLSQLGYHVTVAANGAEALAVFNENPNFFDLVITDYHMPGMTGCELAATLKSLRGALPIIMLSGLSETIAIEEIEQSGISVSLNKPVAMETLKRTIRSILDD